MTVTGKLRGHHLLCLRFFQGRGYNSAFVSNMQQIAARLAAHPQTVVALTCEPDDLCRACPNLRDNQCRPEHESATPPPRSRDERILDRLGITPGTLMPYEKAQGLVDGLLREHTIRSLCHRCTWLDLCEKSAP